MGKYSDTLMDHFLSPRNSGHMESPDLLGMAGTPGNGPFVIMYLRLLENTVTDARFQTHGCGATIAAGSILSEMVRNLSIEDCLAITPEKVVEALGGVPPDKLHSPALAVGALHAALDKFRPSALAAQQGVK